MYLNICRYNASVCNILSDEGCHITSKHEQWILFRAYDLRCPFALILILFKLIDGFQKCIWTGYRAQRRFGDFEVEKRQTYRPWNSFLSGNRSLVSAVYNSPKQLKLVSIVSSIWMYICILPNKQSMDMVQIYFKTFFTSKICQTLFITSKASVLNMRSLWMDMQGAVTSENDICV